MGQGVVYAAQEPIDQHILDGADDEAGISIFLKPEDLTAARELHRPPLDPPRDIWQVMGQPV